MSKLMAMMAVLMIAVGLVGCVAPAPDEAGASMQALLGNDFTGNYVKVLGNRSVPADGKYPCINQFEVCLGLDPAGATAAIKDLCPSTNTPAGTWAFSYIIYADAQCTEALGNLGCPPTVGEVLNPGHNKNEVTCITRNADKSFDFCVMDPVTGAGSEACPPCIPGEVVQTSCNPQ
jgi:hypothetical protein